MADEAKNDADDQVLKLAAKITQLRSAEADVVKAHEALAAVTKRRDVIKQAVEKLRSGQGAVAAPSAEKPAQPQAATAKH